MLNNFIFAKKKSLFENALNNGLVLSESIVFIEDTKEIWNHGTYFDGSTFDPSDIEESIENIINNKADKTELPTKTSDLTNDSGFITIDDVSIGNLLKTYTFYVDNVSGNPDGYTITQSELEEIQNADIVYIFIDKSKKKIQLTSKIEDDYINFSGYDFELYPSTVFDINVEIHKTSDNIEVRIWIDSIGLDDYISENVGTSYAVGVCLSEEFVNGAEIGIMDNMDLILDSAGSNFRPVILVLTNSNNDKGVILHGPYVLFSSDDMPSIKFIGEFNDLTIECVLRPEDNYLVGTLHVKSQSEGGSVDLNGYATQEWVNEQGFLKEHQDISHLAKKSELPVKTSDLENDSEFITINDIPEVTVPTKVSELENDSQFITLEDVPEVSVPTKTSELTNDSGFITINDVPVFEIPDEYVTETELSQKGFLVSVDTSETLDDVETNVYVKYVAQTLTDTLKLQVRENIGIGENVDLSDYVTKEELSSKQDTITDLETIRQGAAKGVTALQSYTEQYQGTITGVSANGTSLATSGVANIPAASTSDYGVTKLSSSTSSTSTTLAATASAVKSVYDLANEKQAKLVSGTNIKTINGESILGSGDIIIESELSIELTATSGTIEAMKPDVIYYTNSYNPNISISGFESDDKAVRDYKLYFYIGETLPTIILPSYLKWANGKYPTFEINTAYELAITATVTYTSESSSLTIYKAVCVPFILDSVYG